MRTTALSNTLLPLPVLNGEAKLADKSMFSIYRESQCGPAFLEHRPSDGEYRRNGQVRPVKSHKWLFFFFSSSLPISKNEALPSETYTYFLLFLH